MIAKKTSIWAYILSVIVAVLVICYGAAIMSVFMRLMQLITPRYFRQTSDSLDIMSCLFTGLLGGEIISSLTSKTKVFGIILLFLMGTVLMALNIFLAVNGNDIIYTIGNAVEAICFVVIGVAEIVKRKKHRSDKENTSQNIS